VGSDERASNFHRRGAIMAKVSKQVLRTINSKIKEEFVSKYRPLEAFSVDETSHSGKVDIYELGALKCSYDIEAQEFCDFYDWSNSY
jgi:hypothetical protein